MLMAAEVMEWEEVERLERERMPVMEKLFSSADLSDHDVALLTRVIEQVQTVDKVVISLAEAERDRAAQELRMLRNSRQGEQVYWSAENECSSPG